MTRKRRFVLALSGVFIIICATYVFILFSDPYAASTTYIENNEVVRSALGNPVKCRLAFWGYSIKTVGPSGNARFQIFVSGPSGSGTVYLDLQKQNLWHVNSASLRVGNSNSEVPLPVQ
jgi:hypothetical protein